MKSALVLVALTVATPAFAASELAAQLDAIVAPHFKADQPGAAVLVKKGDQILLRKGYGLAEVELGVPVRPELVFRIGSVTKQFTAAAIMMLADEGKLALADDIRKYVPEYPKKSAKITIEHLLTHTGGVPDYTEQPAFEKREREDLTHAEVLALFKDLPLDFVPGEKWKYSNSGYYLLGMVIEKVSGKSYAQFLDERIFKPLAMTHTTYGDDDRIISGRVAGYSRSGADYANADFISMKLPFAAGSLVSSVDDLAKWDRAISDGKLLKKASWTRVFTAAKLKDGSSAHYGFGWVVGAVQGRPTVWHNGGIQGFATAIVRLPADGVLVVVLCNSIPAPTSPEELGFRLAAAAIGKPIVEPKAMKLDVAALERYAGVYGSDPKLRAVVRRAGDHLTLQHTGGPQFSLDAESDGKFFVKGALLRVSFLRDAAGRVTGLDATMPDGTVEHRARTDEPLPPERAIVSVPEKTLEGYVGNYELAPGFVIAITRDGARLYAQATGQGRFQLFASAPTEFFLEVVDAQLSFHVDKSGRADSLVLHQNGRDMPGKRVP